MDFYAASFQGLVYYMPGIILGTWELGEGAKVKKPHASGGRKAPNKQSYGVDNTQEGHEGTKIQPGKFCPS